MIRQRDKVKGLFLTFLLLYTPSLKIFAAETSATSQNNTAGQQTDQYRSLVEAAEKEAKEKREAANADPKNEEKKKAAEEAERRAGIMRDQLNRFEAANKANSENLAKNNPSKEGGGSGGGGGGEEKKGGSPPPSSPPPSDKKGDDKKEEPKQPEAAKAPPPPENPLNKIQPPKEDPALAKILKDLQKSEPKTSDTKTSTTPSNTSAQLADLTSVGNKATSDIIAANKAAFEKTSTQNTIATQAKQTSVPKTVGQKIQETALASKRGPAGTSSGSTRINEMPAFGILPGEAPDHDGALNPLEKQLSMRNQRGVFKGPVASANLASTPDIIPSLYDLCQKSPGCMKK